MVLLNVEPDGTVLIPDEMLREVGASEGDEFEVEIGDGEVFLRLIVRGSEPQAACARESEDTS
ncbi:hypothetical protein [Caulobacter sp.]|uniref:hypothetical protein n=1 Tax=Caulobacter sp. TaxID=78 RepID=UPI001B180DCD|nr:hypothetical protein [Caulobacter sp.]MBO9547102.1 AbrB/MazE/SpoVT family DNA-binding domain-containing protein [Caulobacter sp.]